MGKFEKLFVNSTGHSQQVVGHFDRLMSYVPVEPNQRYLDVGCGNGAGPIYLAQTYHLTATGIDVDPEQIRLAQANSAGLANTRFLTIDGTELPFTNQEFDIVATNKVMHHIPNWLDALAEMVRVLKHGGYFVYADLAVPAWVATIGQAVIRRPLGFPTNEALSEFFTNNSLTAVHLSISTVHYEGVFQKG